MRVLAFDPGYERLGVAVLEKERGKEKLVHSVCVRTSAKLSFPERLRALGAEADAMMKKWEPDIVALEEVFFEKNAKTAMQVAEVRGVLAYLAAERGIAVRHFVPSAVKIAITGYGRSNKRAVAAMLPRLVQLPARKRLDDELDAIAVGLACLTSQTSSRRS